MPRISLTDRSRVARISSQMAKLLRGQMRPSPPLLLLLLLSVMERNDELWKIFLWWVARRYHVESFVTVETLRYAADLTDKSCRFLSVENINFFLIWFRLNAGNNKVEQVWPTFPLPSLFFFFYPHENVWRGSFSCAESDKMNSRSIFHEKKDDGLLSLNENVERIWNYV